MRTERENRIEYGSARFPTVWAAVDTTRQQYHSNVQTTA